MIIRRTIEKLLNLKRPHKKYVIIVNLLLTISVYIIVYFTGGIKHSYSHTMYIPIIIVGFSLGWKWGVLFGIFGGLLLGPFMPYVTNSEEQQLFINWFYRLLIYVVIGMFSGTVSNTLRDYIKNLTKMTTHHYITNIPNLYSLRGIRISNRTIIALHLNNYNKIINLLGPETYSKLVNEIYNILKEKLPSENTLIQADSSKLWITLPAKNLIEDVKEVSSCLSRFLVIDDIPIYVECSIGANSYEEEIDLSNPKTYQIADDFSSLATKKNLPYIIYNKGDEIPKNDINLLSSFNYAIEHDQLILDYQPKIDLSSNKILGFEALVRWQHPIRGLLMPDEFIPLLEETRLIDDLTYYVINKAIEKIGEFKKKNLDICISINLSIKNLITNNFVENILKIANKDTSIRQGIEFEVTESVLIDNFCKSQVNRLHDEGFRISLDDFGKGYSSLGYLSEIKFSQLKIDKYFILTIEDNKSHQHIVKAAIDLAHNLGHKVVAEGIETKEASLIVKDLNCDYGQGFYYAKPINGSEVISWYKNYCANLRQI